MKLTRIKIDKATIFAVALIVGLFSFTTSFDVHSQSVGGSSWTCAPNSYASYCVTPEGYTAYYHYRVGGVIQEQD